jgi:hypothetical protein
MFARILKANPFHAANGMFDKAPASHAFARDMQQQYAWLKSKVKRMKLPTVDHLVEQHPEKFSELASLWRQRHPMPN